jgi:hypothetical protein
VEGWSFSFLMTSGQRWSRCYRRSGRRRKVAGHAPDQRHWPASCLCCGRAFSGTRYQPSWDAAASPAGDGWASGTRPEFGPGCIGCGWSGCRSRVPWTGAGRRSTAPAYLRRGGAEVGPNPTDRGKPGTKRHLVTDAQGTPLGVTLSGPNRHDGRMLAPTVRCRAVLQQEVPWSRS